MGRLKALVLCSDSRQFVLGLAIFAFALRLAFTLVFRDILSGPIGGSSADDVQFHNIAIALAEGRGYALPGANATAFRAPGFPFFLAALYSIVGVSPLIGRLAMCALGAAACALTYVLARALLQDEIKARVAGLLLAVYLGSIVYALDFVSEALSAPLLALLVLLFLRYFETNGLRDLALCGVVLGVLALTRPFALLAAPIYALFVMWRLRAKPGAAVVAAAVLTIATCAPLAPWLIRNKLVMGHAVMSTNGGSTFYGSNNDVVFSLQQPRFLGYWVSTTELPGRALIDAQPNEYEHDRMEWKLGLEWVQQNAIKMPLFALVKLGRGALGLPDFETGLSSYAFRIVSYIPYFLMFAAGVLVCLFTRAYWSERWLALHIPNLALALSIAIFAGLPRFRDGNAPLLMVYAVIGAWALREWTCGFLRRAKVCTPPKETA